MQLENISIIILTLLSITFAIRISIIQRRLDELDRILSDKK